jgi:hypothetical protein
MARERRPSKAAIRFCNGKLVRSEDKASGGFGKAVATAYAACVAALAAAHRLDDVKNIRDGALALPERARGRQRRSDDK